MGFMPKNGFVGAPQWSSQGPPDDRLAVGTLAGAFLGSEVGKSLDKADKIYAERTAQNAMEYSRTGHPVRGRYITGQWLDIDDALDPVRARNLL